MANIGIRRMTAVAAILAAFLVTEPTADADPGSDFLAVMNQEGINLGDTPADVSLALATAETVCLLLHYGHTTEDARRAVGIQQPTLSAQQIASFVDAAQVHMCDPALAPLYPGGD